MPIRIAIINKTGGGMSGGYHSYIEHVLPRLALHPQIEAVLCATPSKVGVSTWFPVMPKVHFFSCRPFRFMHHRPSKELLRTINTFTPDVLFIPIARYLAFDSIPLVTMVQNMGPLQPVIGNPITEYVRYIAQWYEMKVALKKAKQVIVPTDFVGDFLKRKFYIFPEKIHTIYYGSSVPIERHALKKRVHVPKGWDGKFLFTAGSIEPYRGLEDILFAMERLTKAHNVEGLIIAGYTRPNMMQYHRVLKKWIQQHGLLNKIFWAGQLSKEEMSWCYYNCRAFIMTSRIEAFAIIGAEAMAHGCICIVANNPPFPEIFSSVALYYPPKNDTALAATIIDVLHWNDTKRHAMSVRVKERATRFSWDVNANQLVLVLQKAIGSASHGSSTVV